MQDTRVRSLGWENSLEKEMAAHSIKNPLVMQETQETWFRSLGQEDALEEGMAPSDRALLAVGLGSLHTMGP